METHVTGDRGKNCAGFVSLLRGSGNSVVDAPEQVTRDPWDPQLRLAVLLPSTHRLCSVWGPDGSIVECLRLAF